MADSTQMLSHRLSCEVLVLPKTNLSSPKEASIVRQGKGVLLSSVNPKNIHKYGFVYIPKKFAHGLKNRSEDGLQLLSIFLTDC